MSRRTLLGLALVATLPLAACTSDPDPDPTPDPTGVTSALRLVAFDSCEQLRDDLRKAAKEAVGPWGFGGGVVAVDSSFAVPEGAEGARAAAGGAVADKAPAPPGFSNTNTHEAGVDEPDIVKTDGRRIVTIEQGRLRVIDTASKKITGTLDLDAYDADLLLNGDRALVLARNTHHAPVLSGEPTARFAPHDPSVAQIYLVDLAGSPRIISKFEGQGAVVDARQTGAVARVVLSSSPRIAFPDLPNVRDEEDRLKANQKAIDKAGLDAWLPEWSVTTGGVTEKGKVRCGDVRRPPTYSGKSMLSVLTFDLSAPKLDNGRPVSIVADGDTVYGTPTSLYVANDERWRMDIWPRRGGRGVAQETEIYRFETTGSQPPVYTAAGRVKGWLINQYAMSEWDGHLRVATTDDKARESAVRVLRVDGDALKQVGSVGGLGKGEQIYSVRFIGDRGYVVTFRQTDPLYSIDLRDPASPRVTGELKITGYSAHLQPVGENRLVGIGQEADEQGRRQGTQVSLFDVSDPKEPRRLAQHMVANAYSEAESDPHAILWWPATQLLVVPVNSDALALTVAGDQLSEAGHVSDLGHIRRSLVIGSELWTLSEAGMTVAALSTLDRVATVSFN